MTRSELLTVCAGLGVAHEPFINLALIIRSIQRLRDGASVVDVQSEVAQAITKAKLAATPVQMPI